MITLAYLNSRTLLDRASHVRHSSPVARDVERKSVAWRFVAMLMEAGAR